MNMAKDYFYIGLSQRLLTARVDAGYSQAKSSELLSVDRSTISKWENARAEPSIKQIYQLSDIYNVSSEWLAFGTGPKRKFIVYADERQLLEKFRSLTPIQQNAFIELFEVL